MSSSSEAIPPSSVDPWRRNGFKKFKKLEKLQDLE
jgi:hypothetical protein